MVKIRTYETILDGKEIKIRAAELCVQAMLQHDTAVMDEANRLRLMTAMIEFLLSQIDKSRTRCGNVPDNSLNI